MIVHANAQRASGGSMTRLGLMCGVAAPLIFAGATVLGGLMRPGYSHIYHAVSELIQAGAVEKPVLDPLYVLYNLAFGAFGLGLFQLVRAQPPTAGKRSGVAAALIFATLGLVGLAMTLFFPMDPRGAPVTFQGTMHLVLAGVYPVSTLPALWLGGRWLDKALKMPRWAMYSYVSFVALLVTGILGGLAAGAGPALPWLYERMGLFERLAQGAYLQWVLIVAWRLCTLPATQAGSRA